MKVLLTILSVWFLTYSLVSQSNLDNTLSYKVGNNLHLISSVSMSPNGNIIAVATVQSNPLYILNLNTKEVIKQFNVSGYYAGPLISYSKTGKYSLLEQQFYNDWNMNKDKAVKYEVMDATSGNIVFSLNDVQDAQIFPNESRIAVIRKDRVEIYSLPNGTLKEKFDLPGVKNSLCLNKDGSKLYISHKFDKSMLKEFPRLNQDKKALKAALKYQHAVSEFETSTFKKVRSFQQVFDEVYDMNLNFDGSKIHVVSKQDSHVGGASALSAFILSFDIASGVIERNGYFTNVLMGDYGESNDGKYFGLVFKDDEWMLNSVQICDSKTSDILTLFKFNKGWFEGFSKKEFQGGQVSFDFSNDGSTLYVAMGNMIYEWEINY